MFRSVKAKTESLGVERVLGFCNLTQGLLRSSLPITGSGLCRVSLWYQQRGMLSVQASSRKDNVVLKAKGRNAYGETPAKHTLCALKSPPESSSWQNRACVWGALLKCCSTVRRGLGPRVPQPVRYLVSTCEAVRFSPLAPHG